MDDKYDEAMKELTKIVYFDGDMKLRIGMNAICANLRLIHAKVFTSFTIHWIDFWDFDVFIATLEIILELNMHRSWKNKIHLCPTINGVMLFRYEDWICKNIWKEFSEYSGDYQVFNIDEEEIANYSSFISCNDETISSDCGDWFMYVNCYNTESQTLRMVSGDIQDMIYVCDDVLNKYGYHMGAHSCDGDNIIGQNLQSGISFTESEALNKTEDDIRKYKELMNLKTLASLDNGSVNIHMRLRTICV